MTVPERCARHVTEEEWSRIDLDSLSKDDRGLVEHVLRAICSVEPTDEEDRRRAVEETIKYAQALAGAPDLSGITEEEMRGAIDTARQALSGLVGGAGDEESGPPVDDGAEGDWK